MSPTLRALALSTSLAALAAPLPAQVVLPPALPSCPNGVNPLTVVVGANGLTLNPATSANPAVTLYAFGLVGLTQPPPIDLPAFPTTCCGAGSLWHIPVPGLVGPITGAVPATKLTIPRVAYGALLGTGTTIRAQALVFDPSGFSPCAHVTDAVNIRF